MPQTIRYEHARLEPLFPEHARTIAVRFAPNLTLERGAVVAEATATGLFAAYDDDASNGLQVAKGILERAIRTDAQGNVFFGSIAQAEHGIVRQDAPIYFCGEFDCADLVGLDADAVSQLGRLIKGDITTGILKVN